MRCLSCDFVNVAQAYECANCKKILDPILASLLVERPSNTPVGTASGVPASLMSAPAWQSSGSKTAPPRPPLPTAPAAPTTPAAEAPNQERFSNRYVPSSADLEFLVDSIGGNRLKETNSQLKEPPQPFEIEVICPSCKRQVARSTLVLDPQGRYEKICQACQARTATRQDATPRRQARIRLAGGIILGGIVALTCILLATQFGVSLAKRELNWTLTAIIGAAIGVAVRVGAFNKPNMAHQFIAVILSGVAIIGSVYMCLNTLAGVSLTLNSAIDSFKTLTVELADWGLVGLGLLLAFVIPSGVFANDKEPEATPPTD